MLELRNTLVAVANANAVWTSIGRSTPLWSVVYIGNLSVYFSAAA